VSTLTVQYDPAIEGSIESISRLLQGVYPLSARAVALLLLAGDEDIQDTVGALDPQSLPRIGELVEQARTRQPEPLSYVLAAQRQRMVERLLHDVVRVRGEGRRG
jgi:hypothetical protein